MTAPRTDCLVIGADAASGADLLSTGAITAAAPRRPDLGLGFLGLL